MAGRGWNLVTPGNDIAILKEAAAARVATVRGSAPAAGGSGGY
jgi:hypothetical protein